jgi:hypothetical protein
MGLRQIFPIGFVKFAHLDSSNLPTWLRQICPLGFVKLAQCGSVNFAQWGFVKFAQLANVAL